MRLHKLKQFFRFLYKPQYYFLIAGIFSFLFFFAESLIARPGGGHGHSGGGGGGGRSSGGGGGGGSGDGGRIIAYILLHGMPAFPAAIGIWFFPVWGDKQKAVSQKILQSIGALVGVLATIGIYGSSHWSGEYYACGLILCVVAFAARFVGEEEIAKLTSSNVNPKSGIVVQSSAKPEDLLQKDPDFSNVLFLDYVRGLYYQFYYFSNTQKLSLLTPFVDTALRLSREKEVAETGVQVSELVIGNVNIRSVELSGANQRIWVNIEANYTLTNRKGVAHRIVSQEAWEMVRNQGVASLPPEKMQVVSCPNCGAAADFTTAGNCQNCGTTIQSGKYQWYLNEIRVLNQTRLQTQGLGTYVQESGTDLPTITHPQLRTQMAQFAAIHGIADVSQHFAHMEKDVVSPIFARIYEAWTTKNWQTARHLMTDFLYESQNFWMQMYKEQQITNVLSNIRVSTVIPVKVEVDKYYESVTFRIYASCIDYTMRDTDRKVIGGDTDSPRKFTEYWTFIRRSGVNNTEVPLNHCQNCGAPVDKMGMSGVCGYCNTKVSSGQFSWVLAYITQDEVYKG